MSEEPMQYQKPVLVYDQHCGFCRWCAGIIGWADSEKTISFVDYRDEIVENIVPNDHRAQISRAVCFYDGTDFFFGFFVFRRLSVMLKRLWWLAPFVFFPGSGYFGPRVYEWISKNRKCDGLC